MASSNSTVAKAEDYEVLDKIGHGSFGIIRRVRRKADGLVLCRKEINYLKMSQKEREQLHAEFQCLSHLRHPNIVAYYHRDHLKETQELHLYMEYCGNGDLGRVIKDLASKGQRASEQFVWSIFGQLSSALYRCHYGIDPPSPSDGGSNPGKAPAGTLCIMHRDLKPENVFLGENNSVKLGDFGLSKMIKSQDFASTYVGTPYYMSPEICAAERYTLKSDIWALGCIIYELCMRAPPFDARSHYELVRKIKEGQYASLPSIYSPELRDAIGACLRKSPDSRPSTHDLLHLPQIRLTRREMEVAELKRKLKQKQEALAQKEKELTHIASSIETEKKIMRQEIDSQLRREWEAKAQLEISRHINMEIENLQKHFEVEVRARVEAELKRKEAASSGPQVRTVTPEADAKPTSVAEPLIAAASESTASEAPSGLTKRNLHTPLKRAQTMYAGMNQETQTPGDIEMVSPSPIAISSLSLSPRRNGTTKPPTNSSNIFRLARAASERDNSANWDVPRDVSGIESDDDEAPASPTPAVRSSGKNPFTSKNRPVLTSKKSGLNKPLGIPVLNSKGSNPELSRVSPNRRLSKIPSASGLAGGKLSSGSSSSSDSNGNSGNNGGNSSNHVNPARTKKPVHHHNNHTQSEDDRLGKLATKNNVRGRTLVELQQARAGGRPLSAVMPPAAAPTVVNENISPKRAFRDRLVAAEPARRSSDPTVWDPEVEPDMPSPFLARTRQVRT